MKLQPASRKEIKRISIGTLVLDVLMIAALFLLSQFGIGKFEILPILLAAAGGTIIAICCFTFLCITVQQAIEIEDQKKMKAKFQLGYNVRMVVQAGWVVVCFFVSQLHIFAGALPLFFPKVTILYLNARGKITDPPKEKADAGEAIVEEEQAPELPREGGMDEETAEDEAEPSEETEA